MVAEIKALCEKNNTSIKELERELGLGNGTIRRWDDKTPPLGPNPQALIFQGLRIFLTAATV